MKINSGTLVSTLNSTLGKTSDLLNKISSGKRLNKASDGPAEIAVAAALNAESSVLKVAARNTSDASSVVQIADSAIEQVSNISTRLSELATQASNGTLSDTQRAALNDEYQALAQEAQRIQATTEFNGQNVISGGGNTFQVGTGSDSNSQIRVQNSDIGAAISTLATQDISTQAGAQAAVDNVKEVTKSLSSARGELGSADSRLSSAQDLIESSRVAKTAAASRIEDEDIASALAKKVSNDIQVQANVAIQAQASNLNRNAVLRLLQ